MEMEVVSIEKEELSAILKPLVAGRNMTQIAKKIGIGDASFRSYVNGKTLPSANALRAIAKYFNIPISKLTGSEKPKENLENIKEACSKKVSVLWEYLLKKVRQGC
jgi:transcriptional regulator with XRE-family HTH domain